MTAEGEISDVTAQLGKDLCRDLLAGVGTEESRWDRRRNFIHLRIPLKVSELEMISEEWHTLPAVDGA